MDEVAAATSRDGLRQIDRHTLHRRVEAHQRTRGHQHQQHQRQVLDTRVRAASSTPEVSMSSRWHRPPSRSSTRRRRTRGSGRPARWPPCPSLPAAADATAARPACPRTPARRPRAAPPAAHPAPAATSRGASSTCTTVTVWPGGDRVALLRGPPVDPHRAVLEERLDLARDSRAARRRRDPPAAPSCASTGTCPSSVVTRERLVDLLGGLEPVVRLLAHEPVGDARQLRDRRGLIARSARLGLQHLLPQLVRRLRVERRPPA